MFACVNDTIRKNRGIKPCQVMDNSEKKRQRRLPSLRSKLRITIRNRSATIF